VKAHFDNAASEVLKEVKFGKIDCTTKRNICEKFKILEYPTLKYFLNGDPENYNGGSTKADFTSFCEKKIEALKPSLGSFNFLRKQEGENFRFEGSIGLGSL
jgi:hypothetical protein